MHIHIWSMKIAASPLFSSFREKHDGVCQLKGQTMKPRSIETSTLE